MAVTLYRCSKCRGVFSAVWDTYGGRLCRDCKLQSSGYGGEVKFTPAEQVKIVEDTEDSMGGGGKSSSAIGGPIGDAQNLYAQAAQQNVGMSGIAGLAGMAGAQGYDFKFSGFRNLEDGMRAVVQVPTVGNKIYEPTTDTFVEFFPGGQWIRSRGDGEEVARGSIASYQASPSLGPPPKPVSESSPHDAILKPSRKLKLAAE